MKYSRFILCLSVFLTFTACSQNDEPEVDQELEGDIVETDVVEDSQVDPIIESEPLVFETMMDYYLQIPDEFMPVKEENRREVDVLVQDETNYYLYAEPTYHYPLIPLTLTVFLSGDSNSLVAIHFNQDEEEKLYFLEYEGNQWLDHTDEILSVIDWEYLAQDLEIDASMLDFVLPQKGTSIRAELAGKEVFTLDWQKGQFEISYSLGVDSTGDFSYDAGEFSLQFPKRWGDVEAYYDFGGFGYSDEHPLCTVCGHVVSFGFSDSEYNYSLLFDVTYFSNEFKGSPEIPSHYELIGESDCKVYYAGANEEDLSSKYLTLLSDLPQIYESFELSGDTCLEE